MNIKYLSLVAMLTLINQACTETQESPVTEEPLDNPFKNTKSDIATNCADDALAPIEGVGEHALNVNLLCKTAWFEGVITLGQSASWQVRLPPNSPHKTLGICITKRHYTRFDTLDNPEGPFQVDFENTPFCGVYFVETSTGNLLDPKTKKPLQAIQMPLGQFNLGISVQDTNHPASLTLNISDPIGPLCGDGQIDAQEQCDDGNTSSTDACLANCQWGEYFITGDAENTTPENATSFLSYQKVYLSRRFHKNNLTHWFKIQANSEGSISLEVQQENSKGNIIALYTDPNGEAQQTQALDDCQDTCTLNIPTDGTYYLSISQLKDTQNHYAFRLQMP